jgi:transcription elongation GreA/GreB family factor/transcription elongation factor GreA-like protein
MAATEGYHQQLKDLLARGEWEAGQTLWLELAEKLADQPEFLLLLVKDFADAGQSETAAELASLLTPNLKAADKLHEWLYALKLQAAARPNDKSLRAELVEAYQQIYQSDPRLRTVLAVAELERSPLSAAIAKADTLLALGVGAFCQHKSWGFGRVKTFDTTLNRIVVAFPHNPDHAMQLPYAAESLAPISADHIEVRKITDMDSLKQLATSDPLDLLRIVLVGYNHAVTADRLETILSGSVIATADWKRWLENVKKLAKRNPHFVWPAKKTNPIVLRAAPVSQQDELLEAFRTAPGLKQKTNIARQFLRIVDEISDPELLLQEFQDGLLDAIGKTRASYQAERLEAALLLEELRAHQRTPPEDTPRLVAEILGRVENLPAVLENLSAAAQKRAMAALKVSQADRLLKTINFFSAKVLDEMADLLPQASVRIAQLVQNQTANPELLCWICKNISSADWVQPLLGTSLVLAVVSALESGSGKSTKKLHDLLLDDTSLLAELLANADTDTVRGIARQLMASPAFDELDRRSLMGRLIKEFPFVQEFVITKTVKEQPPIVSWASYHKRQAELDDIIQKKIPQIGKEIALARSYGDLSENFEYKAAKDMQKLLMRRRAELEILLSSAQAKDFADTKTDAVSIGTSVTVTDLATNQPHTYHILGAWDSNPERGIISYPAALAQTLLNKKVGDTVEAAGENGPQKLRIDRIEKVSAEILQTL